MNLKTGVSRKQSTSNVLNTEHFLPPDTHRRDNLYWLQEDPATLVTPEIELFATIVKDCVPLTIALIAHLRCGLVPASAFDIQIVVAIYLLILLAIFTRYFDSLFHWMLLGNAKRFCLFTNFIAMILHYNYGCSSYIIWLFSIVFENSVFILSPVVI